MSSFKDPLEASGTWGDDITVNMDGGVGGSWKVECAIDEDSY